MEVTYKDILEDDNIRIEAEFYISDRTLTNNYKLGKDIIDFVQYGTSKELNEDNLGFPILRLNEFESHFIGEPSKYCNIITEEVFQNLVLKQDDILICRTNGNPKYVGKSALVMVDTNIAYASYLFKIRPKKEFINATTLSIFLNSKYGREEIEKYSMVSNQANFSPAKFREIRIPIFSNTFQSKIEILVKQAYQRLEQSKTLYKQSEELLLKELDLLDFEPSKEKVAIKLFSDSFGNSGRLDSEYYQPKYNELIDKIKSYKGGYKQLTDIANTKRGSLIPDSYYGKEGKGYIRGADISSNILTNRKLIYINSEFESKNETIVKTNDILFALIGSVGTASLVTNEFNNSFLSNNLGLIRLNNSIVNPIVLHLILISKKIGKMYFEQKEMRTAQPKISDKDIYDYIIPIIDKKIQTQIEEKIKESFKLKEESKRLLEVAKRAVEMAIEEGEDLAMGFIKDEVDL